MLCDTVKMIAYRAETAMVALLRRHLKNDDEARALIRDLFVASADIEPDERAKTLTIRIHRVPNPAQDKAIAGLLDELTQQGFCHPETGARMIYALVRGAIRTSAGIRKSELGWIGSMPGVWAVLASTWLAGTTRTPSCFQAGSVEAVMAGSFGRRQIVRQHPCSGGAAGRGPERVPCCGSPVAAAQRRRSALGRTIAQVDAALAGIGRSGLLDHLPLQGVVAADPV